MHKWYFCSVDGPNIAWKEDHGTALKFSSKEDAERETKLLNSGLHLITPSDGGARLRFHNFRAEEVSENTWVVGFDVEPESGLRKRT